MDKKERYHSDPEYRRKVLDNVKAWRKANPERARELNKAACARWYKANRERILARQKSWYASLSPERRKNLNRDRYLRTKALALARCT